MEFECYYVTNIAEYYDFVGFWSKINEFKLDMTFVAWNKRIILGVSDFANEEEVFIEHLLIFNNVDSYLIPVSRKVALNRLENSRT